MTSNSPIGAQSRSHPNIARSGDMAFCGAVIGSDPSTGLCPPELEVQLRLALSNLEALLESVGARIEDLIQARLYIRRGIDVDLAKASLETARSESRAAWSVLEIEGIPTDFADQGDVMLAIDGIALTSRDWGATPR